MTILPDSPSPRPLKIALYMHDMAGGGVERLSLDLLRGFKAAGHDVALLLHACRGVLLEHLPRDVQVISFDTARVSADVWPLMRYLWREKPDILLSSLDHQNVVALTAKILTLTRTKVLVCQHNALSSEASSMTGWKYRLIPILYRLLCPAASAIIAVSHGVAKDLVKACGISPARIDVLYNPVIGPDFDARADEPVSHPWFDQPGPPVFLTAGRLVPQKNHAMLLRAFALYRAKAAGRLMILGEGPLRESLQALAVELGVVEDVAFLGFMQNPLPYMKRAAAFLLSSHYEGFGNVVVEAMGCGTPTVAFDCSFGPAEILDGGRYGRLVAPGEIEAFAEAISSRLRDDYPVSVLKARAACFTVDKSVRLYLDMMRRVLGDEGGE